MISKCKILALIPARGGSKGIKNKNIVDLVSKPLISYTIKAALKSRYVDSVVVSTDSPLIKSVALQYGARVPFLRPDIYATDTSKTIDTVIHAINILTNIGEKYDILVLLQPTQPLRNSLDIDKALEMFIKNKRKSLLSVCLSENNPVLMRLKGKNGLLCNMIDVRSDVRRQELKKYYCVNGAIYINLVKEINSKTSFNDNKIGYVMPKIRSVDIDENIDLIIAKAFIESKGNK